jgi:hypothetical protein
MGFQKINRVKDHFGTVFKNSSMVKEFQVEKKCKVMKDESNYECKEVSIISDNK